MGQLGVGPERGDLEEHAEHQCRDVDVGQVADLAAVAGDEGEGDVEEEEEHEDGPHAEPYLPAHEGAAVPPAPSRSLLWGVGLRRGVGLHHRYVGTARPLGPAMLRAWPSRARSSHRAGGRPEPALRRRSRRARR